MAPPKLPSRFTSKKRISVFQLLTMFPALVLWTQANPENASLIIPVVLAFAYELAFTRGSYELGDVGLMSNALLHTDKEQLKAIQKMSDADAEMEAIKNDTRLKKNAEMARKKAIKRPCTFPKCDKNATHAYRYGEGDRCEKHSEDRKRQYMVCTCGKAQPSYNLPTEISPAYCGSCKTDAMTNIVNRMCACGKSQPSLNYPENATPLCCVACAKPGMIAVRAKCVCGKAVPMYNERGETKPAYCSECKTETMINVRMHICIGCKDAYAHYNFESERKPIYCGNCKHQGMVSLSKQYCPGAAGMCTMHWNSKYRGYCTHCFVNTFPNDPLCFVIQRKSKENKVRDYINSTFPGFQHDQPLFTGNCDCTVRRRVDHRKLIGGTMLAIETDESQHKSYNQMDEQTRYNDLYMAYSGKWVYIRFNPDSYRDKRGVRCDPPLESRFASLGDEIRRQMARINAGKNEELVERIYMYYDGYA